MAWEVEFTDEFNQLWDTLTGPERQALRSRFDRLRFYGPTLSRKHSKVVETRDGVDMRELRVQTPGLPPLRAFYAFDPRPSAIILLGGDKAGDRGFYVRNIHTAYNLYDGHIARLRREGLI